MRPSRKLSGIGIDSISWGRIERFLGQHSFPFIRRLLVPSEQEIFQKTSEPLQFFARTFAAKEAYFKARGGSWMGEAEFRGIEVVMEEGEKFHIRDEQVNEGTFFELPNGIAARVFVWGEARP